MSKDHDKEFDDFFRKGMEDPVDQNDYREQDWNALEKMLDKGKKRKGIVYWLPVLSGVAALLLLFLGWWAFQPKKVKYNQSSAGVQNHEQPNNRATDTPKQLPTKASTGTADLARTDETTANGADSANIAKSNLGTADYAKTKKTKIGASGSAGITKSNLGTADYAKNDHPGKETPNQRPGDALAAVSAGPFFEPAGVSTPLLSSYYINSPANPAPAKNKTDIKKQGAFRPQYALTVLAAPDLNGVESFQQAQVGTNLGMIFSASVLKKLTVSTGVIYSDKPYNIAAQDYHTPHPFPVSPQNISAVCHMLDVPINVNYQLYDKRQNKIYVGTGLSSYIMLNENYQFSFSNQYYYGRPLPSNYTVPHSGSYYFGVVNLSATYQRQLNSKFALDVQPYYKLPIKDLGYGQVRLQSTGVAVGLTWNLNSVTKH
jgi:hypothetical protein